MYRYQEKSEYFAQVAEDIKDIAILELTKLGVSSWSEVYRGIRFQASLPLLYSINFSSRLVSRVLAPLVTFNCRSDSYLYKKAREIPWEDFIGPNNSFCVQARVANSAIKHSRYAALKLKDALVDRFRDRIGQRPTVDRFYPDLPLQLYIERNRATISVDTSGGSLHRRGYRKQSVEAPLSEILGAAIIRHTGWEGDTPLYDPFCGSGTLLAEAYMAASNTPAGIFRKKFGFECLPDFNPTLWEKVKKEALSRIISIPGGLISGSDISPESVAASRTNLKSFSPPPGIKVAQRDIFELKELKDLTIVCNPPYGLRLEQGKDLSEFYRDLGDFLKQRCQGSTAYIYFGERRYLKKIGLRSSWKKPLVNGGLDGRLAKFEMY